MQMLDNICFEDFFDSVDELTGILDPHGRLIRANAVALELTGLTQEQVRGLPLWGIPWPALSKENRRLLKRAVNQAARGRIVRDGLEIRQPGKPEMMIDLTFKPILDDGKGLRFLIVEGRDVSDFMRTSEALYQSEARFRTIFDKAGIGIVIKGIDGKMLDCNPAFQTMLGYTPEELRQLDYLNITHPLDKTVSRRLFRELVSGKRMSYSIDKRYLAKNGEIIWGRITTSLVLDPHKRMKFVIGTVENITTQKQIEAELVELQHRLMKGREAERLRVAQDLHDGPLQQIIGVSYQVQALKNAIKENPDRETLQSMQDALQQLARSVRNICSELRPSTLIPFGLERTIVSHARGLQAAHPELKIELALAHDGQRLSEHIRIVLFRIYQEALNNVIRHAQASNVWVRFSLSRGQAILEIQDDGVGFELPNRWIKLARQGHLGLVGAMERAQDVGGRLSIQTAPGQGTLIRAVLPVKEAVFQFPAPGEEGKS
jgi:PAS domain S-box-containing protein